MINPFDNTFFKFLIGFVIILFVSFAFIFAVGKYNESKSAAQASSQSSDQQK